eukprot:4567164-Heterocapsa_arctica.AAC.1
MRNHEFPAHDGGLDNRACSARHRVRTPTTFRLNVRGADGNFLEDQQMITLLIDALIGQGINYWRRQ